jgi:hypothetical protein
MAMSWQLLAPTLAGWPGAVVADCGRITGGTAAAPVLAAADYTLLLATPHLDALAHLRHVLAELARPSGALHHRANRIGVVLTCTDKQARIALRECAQVLHHAGQQAEVLGRFGYDPEAAAGLRGQWGHRLDHSDLVGTARELVHATVSAISAETEPTAAAPAPELRLNQAVG